MMIPLMAAALVLSMSPASAPQGQAGRNASGSAGADEILVVGRRSGIPMWRVEGRDGTVFLVGAMDKVVRGTRWDPAALTEALQRSSRVMFPNMRQAELGLFTFFRLRGELIRHAALPAGRSLQQMLSPEQMRRLHALHRVGKLKAGYERRHPFHVAGELRESVQRQIRFEAGIYHHVRRTVRKHRLNLVPFTKIDIKTFARDFFAAPPQRFVPCLLDSIDLAEQGSAAYAERSRDWARRAVMQVVASPAQRIERSCRFSTNPMEDPVREEIRATVERQLGNTGVTLAVVNLSDLAGQTGILTKLEQAGRDVSGPAWR